ncbi:hypothetical protein [Chryseolinea lacunae]|uniref:Uncharacterized protein n=1 Tax=Chryseolinea lacunae TaxID=2801331 RepID=A0ABS1KL38_9BACT|nr:hypothetical protein [Chryseolinea lacunae]MBL0739948.1 hypothetical protein [Chryseolinea lacunae]
MSQSVSTSIMVFAALVLFYFCCGIFLVKPTRATTTQVAHPGATILYFRAGLAMPFITSTDGMISDSDRTVNTFTRAAMDTTVNAVLESKVILELPYSKWLYLRSTGGVDYMY